MSQMSMLSPGAKAIDSLVGLPGERASRGDERVARPHSIQDRWPGWKAELGCHGWMFVLSMPS